MFMWTFANAIYLPSKWGKPGYGSAVRSIVRRGPLRSFDLAHLMLTRIAFPAARVSEFERESAA